MFLSSGSGHNKGLAVLFAGLYALLCWQFTSPHPGTQRTAFHCFPCGLSGFNSSSHKFRNQEMAPLQQLRCTGKYSACALRHHCFCLLNLPSFWGGKKQKEISISVSSTLQLQIQAGSLLAFLRTGPEYAYFSISHVKLTLLPLNQDTPFFKFIFLFSRMAPGETGALSLHCYQGKKEPFLREASNFSTGLLELLLQEVLEGNSQVCSTAAAYLTWKVRQEEGWERAETKIIQTL